MEKLARSAGIVIIITIITIKINDSILSSHEEINCNFYPLFYR